MSSPTPPAATASATPSPLAIGRTFLKQFYHVLTTSPDMIYKFYNPSSVLSHGEGSKPTTPTTMESLKDPKDLKDRFFSWAANPEDPVRFELENGAIDAQESINGGVLLVVTGHMYLGEDNRRPFCHTFFLHPFSPPNSTKRSYYVHNDVLRFLQVDDSTPPLADAGAVVGEETTTGDHQPVVSAEDEEVQAEAAPAEEEKKAEEEPTVQEIKEEEEEVLEQKPALEQTADQEEPVEETRDEPIDEEAVEETKEEVVVVEETKEDSSKQRKTKGKKNGKAEQLPASPKPPAGSWASLVASSADKPVPPAPPKKPLPAPPKKAAPAPPPAPTIVPATATTEPMDAPEDEDETPTTEPFPSKSTSDHVRRHRRDPDNTLVIKNVPDGAKEADIRTLFEPFATATSTKVVGITVSAHRGLAFVDYDSAAPVVAALESPDRPFSLNGRVLDMEQKTMDVQRRAARGGGSGGGGGGRNAPPSSRSGGAENGGRGGREGRGGGPRRGGGGRDGRGGSDRGGGREGRGGGRGGR